jgi:hypothetical protein
MENADQLLLGDIIPGIENLNIEDMSILQTPDLLFLLNTFTKEKKKRECKNEQHEWVFPPHTKEGAESANMKCLGCNKILCNERYCKEQACYLIQDSWKCATHFSQAILKMKNNETGKDLFQIYQTRMIPPSCPKCHSEYDDIFSSCSNKKCECYNWNTPFNRKK